MLSLAMIPVDGNADMHKLQQFLKNNNSLLHADLSGMFSTVEQVQGVIKAIKKSSSLLALHLDNTPIIKKSKPL